MEPNKGIEVKLQDLKKEENAWFSKNKTTYYFIENMSFVLVKTD